MSRNQNFDGNRNLGTMEDAINSIISMSRILDPIRLLPTFSVVTAELQSFLSQVDTILGYYVEVRKSINIPYLGDPY